MWCETCCNGTDLGIGSSCSVCGTIKKVVGYRKVHQPQNQLDADSGAPIISLMRKINRKFRSKK